ncbi:MAG: ArsR family transcriptional regulator [Armatimonadia bacterium]|nr:ArsR family transcriptional regulator [Armatimonadia bacterium]
MAEVDSIIHQPTRLRIMMALLGVEEADFNFLQNALELTAGNLSAHAAKLEDAGLIEITKRFEGKTPVTTYRLTDEGRERLDEYWQAIDAIRETPTAMSEEA